MKTPKRKRRSRLPAYSQLRRDAFAERMADAGLPVVVQSAVMQSLLAATNPDAENPLVVIAAMDADDRRAIEAAAQGYAQTLNTPGQRGRAALLGMSDEEWNRLFDDEGDE